MEFRMQPFDEVLELQCWVAQHLKMEVKRCWTIKLFCKLDESFVEMDSQKRIGDYFPPGLVGVVHVGITLGGGGGPPEKRGRTGGGSTPADSCRFGRVGGGSAAGSAFENASSLRAASDDDDNDDDADNTMYEEACREDSKEREKVMELINASQVARAGVLENLDLGVILMNLQLEVRNFKQLNGMDFMKGKLKSLPLPLLKKLVGASWLTSKNGRFAMRKLTTEFFFEKEVTALTSIMKSTLSARQALFTLTAASVKIVGVRLCRELVADQLMDKVTEDKKKQRGGIFGGIFS